MNHRGHRGRQTAKSKELSAKRLGGCKSSGFHIDLFRHRALLHFALCPLPSAFVFLCVLCGLFFFVTASFAQTATRQPPSPEKRLRYEIKLALDFDNRSYTGSERVRFVNRGEH